MFTPEQEYQGERASGGSRVNGNATPVSAGPSPFLHLPPPGRPNWRGARKPELGLQYLAWGHRKYGEAPIPLSLRDGWTYLVILSGTPFLLGVKGQTRLKAGAVLIVGPRFTYGLSDEFCASCEVIAWIWQDPPIAREIGETELVRMTASSRVLERLTALHLRTREEVLAPDKFSRRIIEGQRRELDALLERVAAGDPPAMTVEKRLRMALEWLEGQEALANPVPAVCDYLQISTSTLYRWFRIYYHSSPKDYFHRLKMEHALTLKTRRPLKEVAYLLGYRHPNDLSRALSRYRKAGGEETGL